MKKIVFILMLVLGVFAFGQKQVNYTGFDVATNNSELTTLQGNWKINTLITNKETREYTLFPQQNSDGYNYSYGNNISINSNGTFISSYSAPCGNDCFTTSTGKYKMIDENYICIFLEEITQHGECFGGSKLNEDLGLFRIYKEEGKIILRRSDGNFKQDEKNLEYLEMLTSKYSEIRGCKYLKWEITKRLNDIKEIADFCMVKNQIKDYEFLYDNAKLILVKVKNDFRYIVYEEASYNNIKVALYEEDFFKNIDDLVYKIDNNKALKAVTIQDDYENRRNPFSRNTITVFKQKKKIQKIIYNGQNRDNKHRKYTYYLKEGKPIACSFKVENSDVFYYIFNWEDKYGAIQEPYTYNQLFSGIRNHYNEFIEVVKKHNKI